jgi:hypothetical protein
MGLGPGARVTWAVWCGVLAAIVWIVLHFPMVTYLRNLALNYRDTMHNEFLGWCRDLAGATVFELMRHGLLGDDPQDVLLRRLHVELRSWCRNMKLQRPVGKVFSVSSFGRETTPNSFPCLHSTYKAASTKTVCCFLAWKMGQISPARLNAHMRLVSVCTWAYVAYLRVLDIGRDVLSRSEANDAARFRVS